MSGRHLRSKLEEAIPMSKKHRALFNALSSTFPKETVDEWTAMVEDWQEDTSKPSPFEETVLGMLICILYAIFTDCLFTESTQDDVERELLVEEKAERDRERVELVEGVRPIHETTASKFLSMGLDLENQQCVNIALSYLL